MPSKDETAKFLTDAHFSLDGCVSRIFRITEADEVNDRKAIKLLEVNSLTPEVGISPIGFGADPSRGVPYSVVVIEVSPGEFDRIMDGGLSLPHGWELGEELHRKPSTTRMAS